MRTRHNLVKIFQIVLDEDFESGSEICDLVFERVNISSRRWFDYKREKRINR